MSQLQFTMLCGSIVLAVIVIIIFSFQTSRSIWKKEDDFSYSAKFNWIKAVIVYDKDRISNDSYKDYAYPELYRIELLIKDLQEKYSMDDLKELFYNKDKITSFGSFLLFSSLYYDPLYGKLYSKPRERTPYDWIYISNDLSSKIRITLTSFFTLTLEFDF